MILFGSEKSVFEKAECTFLFRRVVDGHISYFKHGRIKVYFSKRKAQASRLLHPQVCTIITILKIKRNMRSRSNKLGEHSHPL
jgi:hypothetical protein